METKTLKVSDYRGIKVYVRRLFRETFEYLVLMDGEVFVNQVEIRREAGRRMTAYSDEDVESAVNFMLHVASEFIDDRLLAKKEYARFGNRFARFKGKVEARMFHLKYKLSEFYEHGITGKFEGGARERHRGNA